MVEGSDFPSYHKVDEEVSQNRVHFEDKLLVIRSPKVTDYKEHSLTTEERDDIIRKYNTEHSHLRGSSDVVSDSEQSDMNLTDSDEYEGMEPTEKLVHLLDELAEVGNIAVKQNMRFLDRGQLDALLTVGQKFLVSWKSSIVAERTGRCSEQGAKSETRDIDE